jgi:hypothetical protein
MPPRNSADPEQKDMDELADNMLSVEDNFDDKVVEDEELDDDEQGEDEDTGEEKTEETKEQKVPGEQEGAPVEEAPSDTKAAALKLRQLTSSTIPAFQRRISNLEKENTDLKSNTKVVEAFQSTMQQFGLSGEEARLGLQMASAWKASPKKLLENLLAQAKAANIQIDGQAPGIDQAAITSMIKAELAPLTAQFRPQQERQQQLDRVSEEIDQLLISYPDSELQGKLIAEIAQREQVPLETAYLKAKVLVAEQGLSWEHDIIAQINAQRARPRKPTPTGPNVSSRRQSSAPYVNGEETETQFSPTSSNRQNTRSLLRELGIRT